MRQEDFLIRLAEGNTSLSRFIERAFPYVLITAVVYFWTHLIVAILEGKL